MNLSSSDSIRSPRFFHVETDADFAAAFPVIVQLRPHLTLETFRERVRRQWQEGYRLAALEADGRVRSLAGYRIQHFLWADRLLYIDDLITDADSRSRQFGEQLFLHVKEIAIAAGCTDLHLDSGTHRVEAHRFYFRQRMVIDNFHFALKLTPAAP
ncbi:MAG: GNAT family N-acetyltransferase [Opitutus sp.]|nr:GNAT family N-acetyltransferase [Opitutus sp.]